MKKIIIVGSGVSGIHFALSVLQKGYDVTMLDVGYIKPPDVNPEDSINDLRAHLTDPVAYFLGERFESFIPPDDDSEYYGIPPNKQYVLMQPPCFNSQSSGFAPLFSFAQGGLAEVWTGGSYPLNADELTDFPFSHNELLTYYDRAADRIGISGSRDDLERFYPFHRNIMDSLDLDQHSNTLLKKYEKHRAYFNARYQLYMGRSRVAALSRDKNERKACAFTGRCLWGCPIGALYTPSLTLAECKKYANFHYYPGMYVRHFNYNSRGQIGSIAAQSISDQKTHEFALDTLVLAAGTLSSSKIFMESIFRKTGEIIKLSGLMDNRQIMVPFLNVYMAGKKSDPRYYQYHQLAMGIKADNPKHYVHGQITTLKSALIHPLIQSIPFDLKTAIYIFRNFHSALGLLNLNFNDYRRNDNYVTLSMNGDPSSTSLFIKYTPPPGESYLIENVVSKVRKAFLKLGCIMTKGMVHVRPMGASVHYSGTVPMSRNGTSLTTTENCRSNDFENLYFVDGTTFPFLPAKNLSLTLMANAMRVADRAF